MKTYPLTRARVIDWLCLFFKKKIKIIIKIKMLNWLCHLHELSATVRKHREKLSAREREDLS
jgi:hypothetical protein